MPNPPGAQLKLSDWLKRLNVRPYLTGADHPDKGSGDAVLRGDLRPHSVRPLRDRANSQHVGLTYFCGGIFSATVMRWLTPGRPVIATMRSVTTFLRHIREVLSACSAPEMRWIAAIANVASVAGIISGPYACCEEIRYPMGIMVATTDLKRGVMFIRIFSRSAFLPLPAPTLVLWALSRRLVYIAPKTGNILFSKSGRRKMGFSHGVNLLHRLALWKGSIGERPSFEPA